MPGQPRESVVRRGSEHSTTLRLVLRYRNVQSHSDLGAGRAQRSPVYRTATSAFFVRVGTRCWSILKIEGFDVHNVPESSQAWLNAKYPVDK